MSKPSLPNVQEFCKLLQRAVFHSAHNYEFDFVPTGIRDQRAILYISPFQDTWTPLRVVWFEYFATGKKRWTPQFVKSMDLSPKLQQLLVAATWQTPDYSEEVRKQLLESVGLKSD